MTIRVVLVDDAPEARRQVRTAVRFRDALTVVGEASTAADAVSLVGRLAPDIVVLDVALADLAGDEALSRMRDAAPGAKLVVYSGAGHGVPRELIADADGYASEDGGLDYLVDLLETLGQRRRASMRLELEFSFASPGVAREFTGDALRRWQLAPLADDALLIVSEMVNNAILHAHSGCELSLSVSEVALRIEVVDHGRGTPDPQPTSATRPHGRGLHLIGAVAAAWGVRPMGDGGKTVWAELLREPGDSGPRELG